MAFEMLFLRENENRISRILMPNRVNMGFRCLCMCVSVFLLIIKTFKNQEFQ